MIYFFPSWYIFHCKNLCSSCLLLLLLCFYKGSILKKMKLCLLTSSSSNSEASGPLMYYRTVSPKNMPNNVNTFKQKFQWYVFFLGWYFFHCNNLCSCLLLSNKGRILKKMKLFLLSSSSNNIEPSGPHLYYRIVSQKNVPNNVNTLKLWNSRFSPNGIP